MSFALVTVEFKLRGVIHDFDQDKMKLRVDTKYFAFLPELWSNSLSTAFLHDGWLFLLITRIHQHRPFRVLQHLEDGPIHSSHTSHPIGRTDLQLGSNPDRRPSIEGAHLFDICFMCPTVSNDDRFSYTASRPRPHGSVARPRTAAVSLRNEQRTGIRFDSDDLR